MSLAINKENNEKPKFKVAEEDIICYKVVINRRIPLFSWITRNKYRTPYFGMNVRCNKLYEEHGDDCGNRTIDDLVQPGNIFWFVNCGVFHMFKDIKFARMDAEALNKCNDELYPLGLHKYRVIKAIIPKGAYYIEGHCSGMSSAFAPAIASNKVIYKEL